MLNGEKLIIILFVSASSLVYKYVDLYMVKEK